MCKKDRQSEEREKLIKGNKFPEVYNEVRKNFYFLHSSVDNYLFAFMSDDNYATLSPVAPAFFYVTQASIALSIVATITELVNKKTVVGVQTLVKIAKANKPNDSKVITDCEGILHCIKKHKNLLQTIRTARNKVYCHFDAQVLDKEYVYALNSTIKPKEIKLFLNELEIYITDLRMHYYNDGHKESLSPLNGPDVDALIDIICESNKKESFTEEEE